MSTKKNKKSLNDFKDQELSNNQKKVLAGLNIKNVNASSAVFDDGGGVVILEVVN